VSPRSAPGNPEVPEADALDQATETEPSPVHDEPRLGAEVPEADALDQSREEPPPD
jgi:hypothetical protein